MGNTKQRSESSSARLRRVAFANKWLIVMTTIVAVSLVIAYALVWPPVYSSRLLFMAETQASGQPERTSLRADGVAIDARAVASRAVLEEVVKEMGLSYDDVHHSFLAHAAHLWSESWIGERYSGLTESLFGSAKSAWDPTNEEIDLALTVADLKASVEVEPLGDTNAGYLTVRGPSPRVAVLAEKIVEVYVRQQSERDVEDARRAFEILDEETRQALAAVEQLEVAKQRIYRDSDVAVEFDIERMRIANLMELEGSLVKMRGEEAALEATLMEIEVQLSREEPAEIASRTYERDEVREAMDLKLFNYNTRRTELLNTYLPDSPEVKEMDQNIAAVTELLNGRAKFEEKTYTEVLNDAFKGLKSRRDAVLAELASARAEVAASEREYDRILESLVVLPEVLTEVDELAREQRLAQQKYVKLAEKRVDAEVSMVTAAAATPTLRVMEKATAPVRPDWPNTGFLLLVAISVGLAAGVGVALRRDARIVRSAS